MLGVLQALFSFAIGRRRIACLDRLVLTFVLCAGLATTVIGYNVSKALHHDAITGVLRAPMSFFDTTPTGRILVGPGNLVFFQFPLILRIPTEPLLEGY